MHKCARYISGDFSRERPEFCANWDDVMKEETVYSEEKLETKGGERSNGQESHLCDKVDVLPGCSGDSQDNGCGPHSHRKPGETRAPYSPCNGELDDYAEDR